MSDVEIICETIRATHRHRVFAMEQRKRVDLSLLSFVRFTLGWSPDLPDAEKKGIKAHAKAIAEGKGGGDADGFAEIVAASKASREPWAKMEKAASKEMEAAAKRLDVWREFGEATPGFGALSLAIIIGEAGPLSNYPKKGHLWKRMGVAVLDGVRQGGLEKTAPKDDWIEHGYNRQRRSRLFTIGDALIKAAGPYREIYLARKAFERERAEAAGLTVLPSAKITNRNRATAMSDGHIHRRAQRYMEKRLLRDLWQAWNRCEANRIAPEKATGILPSIDPIEREAFRKVPSGASEGLLPARPYEVRP